MKKTFAVQHPNMSHALLIDSHPDRRERSLKAWASMHIAQQFDVILPIDEFVVAEVPSDTPADVTLFG